MKIAEFARAGGVGVETVRYYQRRGLLSLPRTKGGGYRDYDAEQVRRLRFIRRLQATGFTLEEIGELIRLDRTRDRHRVHALSGAKIGEIEARMRELRAIVRDLRALVADCETAPSGSACPIIDALMPPDHDPT